MEPAAVARFRRAIEDWVAQSNSLRIFVFGKTGVGKSSLINTLLGREVAKEGASIHSQTKISAAYSDRKSIETVHVTIENINVTLWDSPGLKDPETDEEQTLKDIQNNCKDIDLFVYCTSLTQMRFGQDDVDSILNLTRAIGADVWRKGLIALTFANELQPPPSSEESVEEHFRNRVSEWREALRYAVVRAGVNKMDAESIPVVPTGYRDRPLPDEIQGDWSSKFWFECLMRIRFMSIPAILQVAMDERLESDELAKIIAYRLREIGDSMRDRLDDAFMEVSGNPSFFTELLVDVIRSRTSWRVYYVYYGTIGTMILVAATFAIAYLSTRRYWR